MFHYWSDGTPEAHVFSFQLAWLFSEAYQGAADTNELFRACKNIRSGNREDWFEAFLRLGEQLEGIAVQADRAGHEATASETYFRAFTALRSAERTLSGTDNRKLPMYRRAMACWHRGIGLSEHPHEQVEVPFEGNPWLAGSSRRGRG